MLADRFRDCVQRSLRVVWGELIDELGHAHAALDRRIVFEGQLRSPLQSQLPGDPRLKQAVRRLEAAIVCSRLRSPPSTLTNTTACAQVRSWSRRR